jgi:hypothetical protein
VEGVDGEWAGAESLDFGGGAVLGVAGAEVFGEALGEFLAAGFAGFVLVGGEEGGDGGVADEADGVEALVGEEEFLAFEFGEVRSSPRARRFLRCSRAEATRRRTSVSQNWGWRIRFSRRSTRSGGGLGRRGSRRI